MSTYYTAAIIFQLTLAFISYKNEVGGKENTAYSKFRERLMINAVKEGTSDKEGIKKKVAKKAMFSSKKGMFYLYSAPYVLATFLFFLGGHGAGGGGSLTASLVVSFCFSIHFFKRMMEVLFIHSYSGPMQLDAVFIIGKSTAIPLGELKEASPP
jgi:hypothetical protein